jgi:hypothetical protein
MVPLLFDYTITAGNYSNLLSQFTALLEENQQDCWLLQDGEYAHTVKTTKAFLQGIFSNCIVRHGLWQPQSPDLIPPDSFLRGFLKETVYSNKLRSLEDLKHNTKQAVALTNQQTLAIQVAKILCKG